MMQTREIVQAAVDLAKKQKSSYTNFLHRDSGHTVSFYDNLVYSLGLFRLKTAESIGEGKLLLEKLLKFQTPSGSFPQYLHEFPETSDTFLPIKLLPVLFQIHSEFTSVLGKDLEQILSNQIKKLIALSEKETLTFPFALTLAVIKRRIHQTPVDFSNAKEKISDFSSQDWGQVLYTLTLLPEEERPPFFFEEAAFLYSKDLRYVGPAHNEPHEGFSPKVSLVDLFLGKTVHLESAKIQSLAIPENVFGERIYPSSQGIWKVVRRDTYALSFMKETGETAYQKNAYLFRLLWGKGSSLVLAKTTFPVSIQGEEGHLEAVFNLPATIPEENKEDLEVALYLDAALEAVFQVEGIKANTFRLGEELLVQKDGLTIKACFSCTKGEGKFFGHILKANRPAQKPPAHKGDFATYDWKIALRTIARTEECQIKMRLSWI